MFDLPTNFNLLATLHFGATLPMAVAGVWVYTRNPLSASNRVFAFALCLPAVAWLVAFGFMHSSAEPELKELWYRIGYAFLCLILSGVYLLASAFSSRLSENRRNIMGLYLWGIALALMFLFGDLIITGVRPYRWGFYPDFARWIWLFVLFILHTVILSYQSLFTALRQAKSQVQKAQIKHFMLGFAVASLWSMELLPAVGVDVYPVRFVWALIILLIFGEALHKYRFLDPAPEHVARKLLVTSGDAVATIDAGGIIRMVNNRTEELLGYGRNALVGEHFSRLLDTGDEAQVHELLLKAPKESEHAVSQFLLLKHRQGVVIPATLNLSSIRDFRGNLMGAVIALRDISNFLETQELLRKGEARLSAVLRNIPEGVAIRSGQGLLEFMSPAMAEMFGDPAIKRCYELFRNRRSLCPNCPVERLVKQSLLQVTYNYETPESGHTYEVTAVPLVEDNDENAEKPILMLIRDVTERKRWEAELTKANEDLKALDRMKDELLSYVSHELRTPLTSIRSFTEILITYGEEDKETRMEFLEIINKETARLTRLINNVLDLSRIREGRMAWHDAPFSLGDTIREVVLTQQHMFEAKSIRPMVYLEPGLPQAHADPDRIKQVLINLVANALKFSFSHVDLRIQASRASRPGKGEPGDWIKVSVLDHGAGIDDRDKAAIFDWFYQGMGDDNPSDRPRGSGLGLPICKEIIDHYQGELWVESKKEEGSAFHFYLPAAREAGD